MGFGLNFSGGEFLPYIRINGKEGRIERSTYDGSERGTEVIDDFVALFDFATVRVGWLRFEGDAPDMRLVAIGDPMPDRPGEDYKQGVKLVVMLPGELGLHEIATTATGVLGALEKVYDEAMAAPQWAAGQVPAVKLSDWSTKRPSSVCGPSRTSRSSGGSYGRRRWPRGRRSRGLVRPCRRRDRSRRQRGRNQLRRPRPLPRQSQRPHLSTWTSSGKCLAKSGSGPTRPFPLRFSPEGFQ